MIAPIRAKNTEITVTSPKLLMMLKKESIRETNPNTIVIPEMVIEVAIC
jgi:hypothetical protein